MSGDDAIALQPGQQERDSISKQNKTKNLRVGADTALGPTEPAWAGAGRGCLSWLRVSAARTHHSLMASRDLCVGTQMAASGNCQLGVKVGSVSA